MNCISSNELHKKYGDELHRSMFEEEQSRHKMHGDELHIRSMYEEMQSRSNWCVFSMHYAGVTTTAVCGFGLAGTGAWAAGWELALTCGAATGVLTKSIFSQQVPQRSFTWTGVRKTLYWVGGESATVPSCGSNIFKCSIGKRFVMKRRLSRQIIKENCSSWVWVSIKLDLVDEGKLKSILRHEITLCFRLFALVLQYSIIQSHTCIIPLHIKFSCFVKKKKGYIYRFNRTEAAFWHCSVWFFF